MDGQNDRPSTVSCACAWRVNNEPLNRGALGREGIYSHQGFLDG